MNYQIIGDSDCPLVHISLANNEIIRIERGSMVYKTDVDLTGKVNKRGSGLSGMMSAIGRSMTSGESFFITEARGLTDQAVLGIAPSLPGSIQALEIGGDRQYRLNTGAFLACDSSVNYAMKKQSLKNALFGGTGGLFVMETEGSGTMLINAYGAIMELTVASGSPIVIDNEHVVAWDRSLDYHIEIASGVFGFKTGEGLVNWFEGNGKVLIQTRNISRLADTISRYLPDKSSD